MRNGQNTTKILKQIGNRTITGPNHMRSCYRGPESPSYNSKSHSGILTIEFPNGSNAIVFKRQSCVDKLPIRHHSPLPVLSRVDPHQRTHQTWDLPLARHANPGPVVPPGLLRATLETGLMQTRAFGQQFLKAEALILMDDTVFPQDFVG